MKDLWFIEEDWSPGLRRVVFKNKLAHDGIPSATNAILTSFPPVTLSESQMPIRTRPWSEVSLADVQDLIDREVREDATIEFKSELDLSSRDAKFEFLKDVTAMANATGGAIIYGALEGEGEEKGQIVEYRGLSLDPDPVGLQIGNIFRDALDERLDGVLYKALPVPSGGYVLVFRIPASPLAPHQITIGSKPRFYRRGNEANDPMSTRQIREMILQRATAEDRAVELIEKRTAILKDAATRREDPTFVTVLQHPDQAVLHVIPLFPDSGGWHLPDTERRLMEVRPLGYSQTYRDPWYAAEGMYSRYPNRRHVLFMRGGGLEFQEYDVLLRKGEGLAPLLQAWKLELHLLQALQDCEALSADGLLPLPILISLRLLDVGRSVLQRYPNDGFASDHLQTDPDVFVTPFIVSSWGPVTRKQIRRMCDEMWQAWHLPQSTTWYDDDVHQEWDNDGYLIPRPSSDETPDSGE